MSRGVNWRQAGGEALLIFVGVVVALAGQAWWEHRADREAERHFLEGVLADLQRDSADAHQALGVARERFIASDYLLSAIGDPLAGRFVVPTTLRDPVEEPSIFRSMLAEGASLGLTPSQALPMAASAYSFARLDLSDATFREAVASGRLDTVRDRDLRAEVSYYYYTGARTSVTADDRAAAQWRRFRAVLTDAGLSPAGGDTDETVVAVLERDRRVLAELRNLRDHALDQSVALEMAAGDASSLLARLRRTLPDPGAR